VTEEFKTEGVPAGEGVLLINISHSLTDTLSYRLYTISLNIDSAQRKIIANKFALPYSLLIFNFVEYRLRSLKIIANKFALPYSLALYLQSI